MCAKQTARLEAMKFYAGSDRSKTFGKFSGDHITTKDSPRNKPVEILHDMESLIFLCTRIHFCTVFITSESEILNKIWTTIALVIAQEKKSLEHMLLERRQVQLIKIIVCSHTKTPHVGFCLFPNCAVFALKHMQADVHACPNMVVLQTVWKIEKQVTPEL